jgi:hypothetical protein
MDDHEPVDISKIKQSKIRSEKDLEKEITEICKTIKDTSTNEWKDRVKAMESVQSIVLTERLVEMDSFPTLMNKLVKPLVAQLMDLRSAVTKEASQTVRIMVQSLEDDFRPLAAKFMHSNALFKLVACATKIISDHGHL